MKYCSSCYFSNSNSIYCYKGLPHWSGRVACDKYYEIHIKYTKDTSTTANTTQYTTTSSQTTILSDEVLNNYLDINSKH